MTLRMRLGRRATVIRRRPSILLRGISSPPILLRMHFFFFFFAARCVTLLLFPDPAAREIFLSINRYDPTDSKKNFVSIIDRSISRRRGISFRGRRFPREARDLPRCGIARTSPVKIMEIFNLEYSKIYLNPPLPSLELYNFLDLNKTLKSLYFFF